MGGTTTLSALLRRIIARPLYQTGGASTRVSLVPGRQDTAAEAWSCLSLGPTKFSHRLLDRNLSLVNRSGASSKKAVQKAQDQPLSLRTLSRATSTVTNTPRMPTTLREDTTTITHMTMGMHTRTIMGVQRGTTTRTRRMGDIHMGMGTRTGL